MKSLVSTLLILVSVSSYAADPRDITHRVINNTSSPVHLTYITCIDFEGKVVCSENKKIDLGVGETRVVEEYPKAVYQIKMISNGNFTRNLSTDAETNYSIGRIPKCKINSPTIIAEHGNELFCESGGM